MRPPATTATASMVLGIIAVAGFILAPVALICGVLAIVFAVRARRAIGRHTMTGTGRAMAGLVCGIIGTVLAAV